MITFTIIKEYLKGLNFSSPHTPEFFFNNDNCNTMLSVNLDVRCSGANDNLFDVTLAISMSPKTKDMEVFSLSVEYSSIVALNLSNNVEEEIRHALMVDVPQTLYPILRDLVAQLTLRSGFPPVSLQNFDFEQNYQSKYNGALINTSSDMVEVCADRDDTEEFSYQTIVSNFSNTKEGEEFVHACVSHGMKPELDFKDTPMYKYLMRFIDVPEFNHPLIRDIDVNWDFIETLYCMLVLDENASCRFAVDEELELYITYGGCVVIEVYGAASDF